MRKTTVFFLTGLLLTATLAYGGSGDLIVDGKLGVGTTSPNARMHIISGDNVVSSILATNNEGPGELRVRSYTTQPVNVKSFSIVHSFYNNENNGSINFHRGGSAEGGFVTIGSYGAERVRIDPSGNVGVGTTIPVRKLDVEGAAVQGRYTPMLRVGTNDVPYGGSGGGIEFAAQNNSGLPEPVGAVSAYLTSGGVGGQTGDLVFWVSTNGTLGEKARLTASGTLQVQGQIYANGTPLSSDVRFKKNLLPINSALDKILNLTGHSYEWKTEEYKERNFQEGRHFGVIAQEIEKVLPEIVNTTTDGSKAVAYTEIIPVLIEAIKEQQMQIIELQKRLDGAGK